LCVSIEYLGPVIALNSYLCFTIARIEEIVWVLFDQNNSKFIVNDPLSMSLNLNIEVSLIDYHELRINL